jgi:hypothetical protein
MTGRFATRKRDGARLTARDLQVVAAVFEARYLTARQIGRLFFGRADASRCRSRMRLLFDLDYLRKRAVGQNDPDIYYLGLQGRRHLAETGACPRDLADRVAGTSGEGADAPALMMRHELTVSRLYVEARLEAARHGWELDWRNARMLELESLGIQPDAWLQVSHRGNAREAFLEFTAAMPSAAELNGKLEGYQRLWERTQRPCAVLWFTTSRVKANRLLEGTRSSLFRDCFLVGLIEDARGFLTRPMWRWADADEEERDDVVQWLQPPTAVGG